MSFQSTSRSQQEILKAALAAVAADIPMRALDIGCGTGLLLCDIAERLHQLTGIGIDVSAENVVAANALAQQRGLSERVLFIVADWNTFEGGPFDLVVSHSTLQMIDGPRVLARMDLAAGGVAVLSLPRNCRGNRAMSFMRAVLRRLRSRVLDRAILALAGFLHRGDELADRLQYMYESPRFLASDEVFSQAGLRVIRCAEMRRSSMAQLKHRIYTVVSDYIPIAK